MIKDKYNDLLKKVNLYLKPLGYKKDGANFRLFLPNGLCKILNFQKSKWNTSESLEFTINAGIYFEKNDKIENLKFKEYECIIRKRRNRYNSEWWVIDNCSNMDEIYDSVKIAIEEIISNFTFFSNKDITIKSILEGTTGNYADPTHLHYYNAKLLSDMGYEKEVYERIKDIEKTNPYATKVIELANELAKKLKG